MSDKETRVALVYGGDERRVGAYMPDNYRVTGHGTDKDGRNYVVVVGSDVAGWTLDDYVLPRLASGLMFGEEL